LFTFLESDTEELLIEKCGCGKWEREVDCEWLISAGQALNSMYLILMTQAARD